MTNRSKKEKKARTLSEVVILNAAANEWKNKPKKEICSYCGQVIDQKTLLKHLQKVFIKQGFPSLASALKLLYPHD